MVYQDEYNYFSMYLQLLLESCTWAKHPGSNATYSNNRQYFSPDHTNYNVFPLTGFYTYHTQVTEDYHM
jgi:hypothetical protein